MFRHKPSEVTVYNTSNFNLTSRMLRHTSSEVAVYNTSKQLTCVSCLSLQFVLRVFLIKLPWPKKNIFLKQTLTLVTTRHFWITCLCSRNFKAINERR